jgi:hypothetical protein
MSTTPHFCLLIDEVAVRGKAEHHYFLTAKGVMVFDQLLLQMLF